MKELAELHVSKTFMDNAYIVTHQLLSSEQLYFLGSSPVQE